MVVVVVVIVVVVVVAAVVVVIVVRVLVMLVVVAGSGRAPAWLPPLPEGSSSLHVAGTAGAGSTLVHSPHDARQLPCSPPVLASHCAVKNGPPLTLNSSHGGSFSASPFGAVNANPVATDASKHVSHAPVKASHLPATPAPSVQARSAVRPGHVLNTPSHARSGLQGTPQSAPLGLSRPSSCSQTCAVIGNVFRVGILLDFVRLTTRTRHGGASYVRRAKRDRIDAHRVGIERLTRRTPQHRPPASHGSSSTHPPWLTPSHVPAYLPRAGWHADDNLAAAVAVRRFVLAGAPVGFVPFGLRFIRESIVCMSGGAEHVLCKVNHRVYAVLWS